MERTLDGFIEREQSLDPESVMNVDEEVQLDHVISETVFGLERKRRYPIVRFENVEGFEFPHVTNVFATQERIARAVDIDGDDFHETWNARVQETVPTEKADSGPVHDTVLLGDEVDIQTQLPAPKYFQEDGGRYISGSISVVKDPETGIRNLAYARTQIKGPRKAGLSVHSRGDMWEYLKKAEACGETLDVAMILGAHPSIYVGASASPAIDVDEYEVIGAVREDPVTVVPGKTVDVEVPVTAEVVVEGTIDPTEHEPEGPFGEYTGYMSGRSTNNVLRIDALTHRENPSYLAVTPANSSEHIRLAQTPKEPNIYQKIKEENPYVTDISMPKSGTLYHCFVSIDKSKPGQPMQSILSALGAWRYLKLVVVVDDVIDVHDEQEVMWAIATCVQADDDVHVFPDGVGNQLDPSSENGVTDKLGIDATRPLDKEYRDCTVPEADQRRATELIDRYLG